MPTIQELYAQQHPGSAALHADAVGIFPDGVTHDTRYLTPFPLVVTHTEGSRKWDVDGNEYIDYVMGHGALLLGHGRPEVMQAVHEALSHGTHRGASHLEEMEWARWVLQLVPSAERVRFTSSGTEATMLALRLARAYTGKTHVLRFTDHFHGWNDLLAVGSSRNMGGIAPEVAALSYVVPANDPALVEQALEAHDDIAAVILEPTGASMGHVPVYPEFLHTLRDLTQKHGVLLIFDEVVTGFRVSPGGAQSLYGVTPDVTTLAKILAGGLPGGAVCGRADVIDMIAHGDHTGDNRVAHPGTFNANPISASAGAAALKIVATGEPNAIADARAASLRAGLNDLMTRMEIPGCCYGVASIFQVRLGAQHQGSDADRLPAPEDHPPTTPRLVSAMRLAAINAGVDLMSGRPSGLVSAAHTEEDIQSTLAGFEQAFSALRTDGLL